jgi:transposase
MGRHELTDQQWQFLAPLLPNNGYKGGQWKDHRTVLNGILWRLRTGALWRDLPARYGPWQTVYHRFNRYRQDGTLDQLLQALQRRLDVAGLIAWDLWCVDGSAIRASRAAAGAGQKGDLMSRPIMPWAAPVAGSPVRSTS